MKISAVVFARKGSKRVKNKMYQKFFNKSLIENKIEQLFKTNVDEIIVGSDDLKIGKIVDKYKNNKKYKKNIHFYLRKKNIVLKAVQLMMQLKICLVFLRQK